ncbi:MAG: M23 family metallopeptidase [Saprospiraceae bacterium]|nr:M23 family metallopeptidase [Saprospiraceae bacterium]
MVRHFTILIFLGVYSISNVVGQTLGSPIKHPLVLTGGFGELRPDHFHAGVDLRSKNGQAGDPILATGAGFISRAIIQRDGYGRALYIQHPDGRTTLYAHLSAFMPILQAHVDTIRYASRREEIDLVFEAGQFPVVRGQILGTMGKTGRANGVHLHYEVRDKNIHIALDPVQNGLQIRDRIPPVFRGLKFYALDDKLLPLFETEVTPLRRGKAFRIKGDTIQLGAWRVGLGISVQDQIAENRFRTGIQRMTISVDDELVYSFVIDRVDFHLNRYINAHLDYSEWVRTGRGFHRCYQIPGNRLPFYPEMKKAGLITLSQNKARKVVIQISDASGNKSELLFWIKRASEMKDPPPRLFQYRIPFGESFSHSDQDIRLSIPAGAFYETIFFQFSRQESEDGEVFYQIHNPETPLHQFMTVAIRLPETTDVAQEKWIGVLTDNAHLVSCGGYIKDGQVVFKSRQLGAYQLMIDTLAPVITPLQERLEPDALSWSFRIRDNVQSADHIRNLNWSIYLDGQWVPGEWSNQDEVLTIQSDKKLRVKAKDLVLDVWDDRGNRSRYQGKINH